MNQINTKEFAMKFYAICKDIIEDGRFVGERVWGDPAGLIGELPTYEISSNGIAIWCAMIQWVKAGSDEINRVGVITTMPNEKNSSLGQIVNITVPFEFKRTYNTRAYRIGENIEIRNYGKFTIGRSGLKKKDFFEYARVKAPDMVFIDEENKEYIKVLELKNESMNKQKFLNAIIKFSLLIANFKEDYKNSKLA